MNEVTSIILYVGVGVVVVFSLVAFDRRKRAAWAKKCAEYSARFTQRRLQPDFAAFASHYGVEAPPPLRMLYEDHASMLQGDFDVRLPSRDDACFVAWFEPLDHENMSVIWPGSEGHYPFANDGAGNLYLIKPGDSDPAVIFFDHETGEHEDLGIRLSEFLAAKRSSDES